MMSENETNKAEFLETFKESGYEYSDEFLYSRLKALEERVNELMRTKST